MLCAKAPRGLRSKENSPDYCWGAVFSNQISGVKENFCVRHYDQVLKTHTTCCFPKISPDDECSGYFVICPQRLTVVFNDITVTQDRKNSDRICHKHLGQADADERVFGNKHYVSPRKVSAFGNI